MLTLNHLEMHYGGQTLFADVDLVLLKKQRIGIIGANGTGKSTLLRIITGTEKPSGGAVNIPKNVTLGWLGQDHYEHENERVVDVVLQGKPDLWKALQEKEEMLTQTTFDEAAGYRLAHLEEIIATHNGYLAESNAHTLLAGLGITQEYHTGPMSALSGGYKLRVLLAQVLFQDPDIMLLDEPTNHLDIVSIRWLEQFLSSQFKGLLLLVSHDRDFLNGVVSHICDIDYDTITQYTGNYNKFLQQKELIAEQKAHERAGTEKKMSQLQEAVNRFGASASRARQAQSQQKRIERMAEDMPDLVYSSRIAPKFEFTQKRPSGRDVLKIENIYKSYEDHEVLHKVALTLRRGERLAVIGPNGMGKSTLIKIIMNQLAPDKGQFEWGHEVQTAYFAQDHRELLTGNISVYKWLNEQAEKTSTMDVRKVLGRMLFAGDEVDKSIMALSGGESARLLLGYMMLQQANVLLLDEPTNHLDIESIEALGKALEKFPGTVILVSHDRHLVAQVATRILALTPMGIKDFHGPYEAYLSQFEEDYLDRDWKF